MRGLKLGRAPNILSFLQIHLKSALMEEKKNTFKVKPTFKW